MYYQELPYITNSVYTELPEWQQPPRFKLKSQQLCLILQYILKSWQKYTGVHKSYSHDIVILESEILIT